MFTFEILFVTLHMKKIITTFFLGLVFILHNNFYAQGIKLEWALGIRDSAGVNNFDGAETFSITTDSVGNVYSAGRFKGNNLEFYPFTSTTISASNGSSLFILKQDSLGNVVWIKRMECSGNTSKINSITTDINNNIIITGILIGTVDFDPGVGVMNITSNGSSDVFILKLDNNGNFLWVKTIGNPVVNEGISVITDEYANIYTVGNYYGTVDFDPGVGVFYLTSQSQNYRDVFVLKLDLNGDFIWAKSVGSGGTGSDYAKNIGLDSNNNVIFGGHFSGSGDFNPGSGVTTLSSGNFAQVFFVKLDSTGNFIWAKSTRVVQYSTDGVVVCDDFKVTPAGDIYFVGTYGGLVSFNPSNSLSSTSTPDVNSRWGYVAKWNSSGNFVFVRNMTGDYSSFVPKSLDLDLTSNIYITGQFRNSVNFCGGGCNVTSNSYLDMFLLKLNSNGVFQFTKNFGNLGSVTSNSGNSIKSDKFNNIYVSGLYRDTVDFDPGHNTFNLIGTPNSTNGWFNAGFSLKLSPCIQTTDTMNINACSPYIAPSGALLITSGTYQDTIVNYLGCDSIITINYTDKNSLTFMTIDRCSNYTVPSGTTTYTSSGTYTVYDTLTNAYGCDSILNILLSINDQYFSTNGPVCDSILNPSMTEWITTNGIYYDTLINIHGCNVYYTDTIQIYQTAYGANTMSGCESVTSLSGNQIWTTSGTYLDTTTTVGPGYCDSILTTTVIINNHSYDTLTPIACYKYISPLGNTYYNSGTYTNILQNSTGCDSVLIINLTILQPSSGGYDSIWVSCAPHISNTGNQTWVSSGTYTDTLYNANSVGCDSVFTVYLTIPVSNIPTIQAYTCDTFVSYSGNQVWAYNGLYIDTIPIPNQYGCDSIINVNLTKQTSYSIINVEFCGSTSYLSPAGNTYTTSGVYYDTLQNHLGCDSIITVNVYMDMGESYISQTNNTLYINFPNLPSNYNLFNIEAQVVLCLNSPWSYNPWQPVNNPYPIVGLGISGAKYEFNTRVNLKTKPNIYCYNNIACQSYYLVGIDEHDISEQINVYPNPTVGLVNIDLGSHYSEISVNLNDIVGRNILNKTLQNITLFDLDIETLPKGVYFIHLLADDKSAIVKIVKN